MKCVSRQVKEITVLDVGPIPFSSGIYGLGCHGSAFQTESCPRSLHLHVIQGLV